MDDLEKQFQKMSLVSLLGDMRSTWSGLILEWILTCDILSKYMVDNSQLAELQNQFQTMSLMDDGEEHMEWSDLDSEY